MQPMSDTSASLAAATTPSELDRLLEAPAATPIAPPAGVVVARLVAFDAGHAPLVSWPDMPGAAAIVARTTVALTADDLGGEVVLQFERGDAMRPIILGALRTGRPWSTGAAPSPVQVEADGERLLVQAGEELTLRCGEASLTLTRAGKVLIRGQYVSQHAQGVMRIRGGAIQLN